MNIQSIVDYGLVIIFFIAMAALVPYVLMRPETQHDGEADGAKEKAPGKTPSPKTSGLAYGLTAVLFALFIAITFSMQKGRGGAA